MFSSRSVTAVITASMMMMSTASARQLQATDSIIELACSTPDLSTFCTAVKTSASAASVLSGDGPFTVFAPNDTAFEALDPDLLKALLTPAYSAHLFSVLAYHVVSNATINSSALPADADADNVTLVMAGGSGETTIGFVNTAPAFITNVTNTSEMYINFTTTDIAATNGIVHVIDGVLLPQWAVTPLAALIPLLATGQYSVIASLIPLVFPDGIPSAGGLTVLAPTDDAFAKIDADVLDAVKANETQLLALLTNHVIQGIVPAELLITGVVTNATMLSGINLPISFMNETVMIGSAHVVQPDVLANNGIIHGIDEVIMGAPTAPTVPTMMMPSAPTMAMPSAPTMMMPSAPTMTMPSAPVKADVDGAAPVSAPNLPGVVVPTSSAFSMIVTSMKMMIGSVLFVVVGVSL